MAHDQIMPHPARPRPTLDGGPPMPAGHHAHAHAHSGSYDPAGRFLLMLLLFFEAILFGLFTTAMCSEQISSIIADQTGIERIKHDYEPQKRSTLRALSETFGRPFSLLWLLPTEVRFYGKSAQQHWMQLDGMEHEV
jgi:hypothetical protein